jgi:hypothetical protein
MENPMSDNEENELSNLDAEAARVERLFDIGNREYSRFMPWEITEDIVEAVKHFAKKLKADSLTHSEALELIAQTTGHSWHGLSALALRAEEASGEQFIDCDPEETCKITIALESCIPLLMMRHKLIQPNELLQKTHALLSKLEKSGRISKEKMKSVFAVCVKKEGDKGLYLSEPTKASYTALFALDEFCGVYNSKSLLERAMRLRVFMHGRCESDFRKLSGMTLANEIQQGDVELKRKGYFVGSPSDGCEIYKHAVLRSVNGKSFAEELADIAIDKIANTKYCQGAGDEGWAAMLGTSNDWFGFHLGFFPIPVISANGRVQFFSWSKYYRDVHFQNRDDLEALGDEESCVMEADLDESLDIYENWEGSFALFDGEDKDRKTWRQILKELNIKKVPNHPADILAVIAQSGKAKDLVRLSIVKNIETTLLDGGVWMMDIVDAIRKPWPVSKSAERG